MYLSDIGGISSFVKEYEIPEMLHSWIVLCKIHVHKKRRKHFVLEHLFVEGIHKKCSIGFGAKVSHF